MWHLKISMVAITKPTLPERSFVFNGNVTTMKGHSVISTDLDSGKRRWELDMPKPTDTNQCVFWFY
jgi:hypothetical protein